MKTVFSISMLMSVAATGGGPLGNGFPGPLGHGPPGIGGHGGLGGNGKRGHGKRGHGKQHGKYIQQIQPVQAEEVIVEEYVSNEGPLLENQIDSYDRKQTYAITHRPVYHKTIYNHYTAHDRVNKEVLHHLGENEVREFIVPGEQIQGGSVSIQHGDAGHAAYGNIVGQRVGGVGVGTVDHIGSVGVAGVAPLNGGGIESFEYQSGLSLPFQSGGIGQPFLQSGIGQSLQYQQGPITLPLQFQQPGVAGAYTGTGGAYTGGVGGAYTGGAYTGPAGPIGAGGAYTGRAYTGSAGQFLGAGSAYTGGAYTGSAGQFLGAGGAYNGGAYTGSAGQFQGQAAGGSWAGSAGPGQFQGHAAGGSWAGSAGPGPLPGLNGLSQPGAPIAAGRTNFGIDQGVGPLGAGVGQAGFE